MKKYFKIVRHYEHCLDQYGDTHLGVDWPNPEDLEKRFQVMLEVIKPPFTSHASLLDFGCGASHFYEFLLKTKNTNIEYSGLDISEKFICLSQKKFPEINFFCLDILEQPALVPNFDFMIMNGVFTEKRDLTFEEMFKYFSNVITICFAKVHVGLAFNVMSKHVDWERKDLFHVSLDTITNFLTKKLTRHFIIRNDYGLYEYTIYLYKEPSSWQK